VAFLKGIFAGLTKKRQMAEPVVERRKSLQQGFYWGDEGTIALAAGQGFNQQVAGESFYREAIERLAGGPTQYGVSINSKAVLQEVEYEGKPSIQVLINGARCGVIPKRDLYPLIDELRGISRSGLPVVAKAKISAGYEGADYSVKLSISRPLKVKTA